ncbi:hypothetical protein ACROYT_G040285 [Oculina patagonica]
MSRVDAGTAQKRPRTLQERRERQLSCGRKELNVKESLKYQKSSGSGMVSTLGYFCGISAFAVVSGGILGGVSFSGRFRSGTEYGVCASALFSGSLVVLITAFASLNWLASRQTVRPSVTHLADILEPQMLHTT